MSTTNQTHLKREELRERIFQNHLAYLAHEDNPGKIEKRKALEGLIAEYLAIVPSREKFIIERVGDVLSHSVFHNEEFSAYKAAAAFQSIEKYANNLLSQPWRKEYRNIKMYSGFYKHSIDSPLPDAHQIFQAMGYSVLNKLELELEEPVDPDPVRHVALDCLVAYVECQIMLQICESVRAFKCTWKEVLGVRQNYICSIEEASRILQQMKIAQQEELNSSKNQHLLPPLAQPEQIIVTPENIGSLWTDNPQFNTQSSQNMLLNLEDDLLGKGNDLPREALSQPDLPTRRSKIQLDGLTISRSRRSPSWTEGLNSSPVFHFNLHDDERETRKPKHNHNLQYNWQSEGSDPFEVYGNFNPHLVPNNGSKTWNTPSYIPTVTSQNVSMRTPCITGRHDSWDFIDHPIIPNQVYLPVMLPSVAPLIPAPPAFSSSSQSNLVNPNPSPFYDCGLRNARSLPRKISESNDNSNQPNYVRTEKDRYLSGTVDILGFNEPVHKPNWKSTPSVSRPVEQLVESNQKYAISQLHPKFDGLSVRDTHKTKTLPNNRNHMALKVGMPLETKIHESKRGSFPSTIENGKFHSRDTNFSQFQSTSDKITPQEENVSSGMTKRNSFYDNVPLIDSDLGLPNNTSSNNTLSLDKNCHHTSRNGYRNDGKLSDYKKSSSLDKNDPRKLCSISRASSGERSTEGKEVMDSHQEENKKIVEWNCAFCTFINTKSESICEMCGRSKDPPLEITTLSSSYRSDGRLSDYNKASNPDKNDYRKVFSSSRGSSGERSTETKEEVVSLQEQNKILLPWNCEHCTFLNTKVENICEICGRSKDCII